MRHSLVSDSSGQGFPPGDGWTVMPLMRVSKPHLYPQSAPFLRHSPQLLQSETSQATAREDKNGVEELKSWCQSNVVLPQNGGGEGG